MAILRMRPLDVADPLAEPAAQLAVGLMLQPQPGKLDRHRSCAVVAGLANALLTTAAATVVWRIGQSNAAADLTAVLEVTIEHLVGQNLGNLWSEAPELGELNGLRLNRARCRRTMRGDVPGVQRLDLPMHQQQPLMLAADLILQTGRQRTPIAGAHPLEIRPEARLQRHGVADALTMQQPLDPVAVSRALLEQPLALTRAPLAILLLRRRNPNHAADTRLAAHMRQKRPHQQRQIDPVGLGTPRPPVHLNARRIDRVIDNPVIPQPPMQPVTIKPSLVAGQDTNRLAQLLRLRPSSAQHTRHRR